MDETNCDFTLRSLWWEKRTRPRTPSSVSVYDCRALLKLTGHALWMTWVTDSCKYVNSEADSPKLGKARLPPKKVTRSSGNKVGNPRLLFRAICRFRELSDRLRQKILREPLSSSEVRMWEPSAPVDPVSKIGPLRSWVSTELFSLTLLLASLFDTLSLVDPSFCRRGNASIFD